MGIGFHVLEFGFWLMGFLCLVLKNYFWECSDWMEVGGGKELQRRGWLSFYWISLRNQGGRISITEWSFTDFKRKGSHDQRFVCFWTLLVLLRCKFIGIYESYCCVVLPFGNFWIIRLFKLMIFYFIFNFYLSLLLLVNVPCNAFHTSFEIFS